MALGWKSGWMVAVSTAMVMNASAALADDAAAESLFERAKEAYAQRDQMAKCDEAISLMAEAEAQAESTELKFDILVLSSRAHYWKGTFTEDGNAKKVVFDAGKNQAEKAKTLGPDYAEGYYYFAINLGRWAEANGIWESLWQKGKLIENAETAQQKETRDGDLGDAVDGYGPDRTLGRVHYKLKDVPGHSLQQALHHLKRAYENAPRFAINIVFYAEALAKGDGSQRALAKQLLDHLLAQDPETFNPDRLHETRHEFTLAREARDQMGN